MTLQVRRIILAAVSVVVGVALTWAIIYLRIPIVPGALTFGFGTDAEHFALSNVALLALSIACIVGIWLDYFLDTKILKS
jgi:hypothetical protein